MTSRTTRRQFLGLTAGATAGLAGLSATRFLGDGAASLSGASTAGTNQAQLTAALSAAAIAPATQVTTEVNHFFSRPDLHPPRVTEFFHGGWLQRALFAGYTEPLARG